MTKTAPNYTCEIVEFDDDGNYFPIRTFTVIHDPAGGYLNLAAKVITVAQNWLTPRSH